MIRNGAYLNDRELKELIHHVAVAGENYEKYTKFASDRGWKLFTKRYLHNWVGRHRAAIRVERQRHLFDLRKASLLDRSERLRMLEESAKEMEKALSLMLKANDVDRAVKVAEQLRKQLEAVAKERGEWLAKDSPQTQLDTLHEALLANMQKGLLGSPDDVEADAVFEVEVVANAAPAV